jgi:hypothetical protein
MADTIKRCYCNTCQAVTDGIHRADKQNWQCRACEKIQDLPDTIKENLRRMIAIRSPEVVSYMVSRLSTTYDEGMLRAFYELWKSRRAKIRDLAIWCPIAVLLSLLCFGIAVLTWIMMFKIGFNVGVLAVSILLLLMGVFPIAWFYRDWRIAKGFATNIETMKEQLLSGWQTPYAAPFLARFIADGRANAAARVIFGMVAAKAREITVTRFTKDDFEAILRLLNPSSELALPTIQLLGLSAYQPGIARLKKFADASPDLHDAAITAIQAIEWRLQRDALVRK